MAKVDLLSRLCPVRKEDWPLLSIHWRKQFYIDKSLPFGLRSAPYLFNIKDYFTVEHCFHYLDDFFLAGPPLSDTCMQALLDMLTLCQAVKAPVKPEKVLGPSTTLPILGILLDTIMVGQARLPDDKLTALQQELQSFHTLACTRSTCTKRQLLSLIGKLAFACKVIPAGRIFLHRLLDMAHSVESLEQDIQIDSEAFQDIQWWQKFSNSWSGKGIFLETKWTPAHRLHLFTECIKHNRVWGILEWGVVQSHVA